MEKALSQAQRDQILLNSAKEEVLMKREMLTAFQALNQCLEQSINNMTQCLSSIGDGIASGMKVLAQALAAPAQPHYIAPPYPPGQFLYGATGTVPGQQNQVLNVHDRSAQFYGMHSQDQMFNDVSQATPINNRNSGFGGSPFSDGTLSAANHTLYGQNEFS